MNHDAPRFVFHYTFKVWGAQVNDWCQENTHIQAMKGFGLDKTNQVFGKTAPFITEMKVILINQQINCLGFWGPLLERPETLSGPKSDF